MTHRSSRHSAQNVLPPSNAPVYKTVAPMRGPSFGEIERTDSSTFFSKFPAGTTPPNWSSNVPPAKGYAEESIFDDRFLETVKLPSLGVANPRFHDAFVSRNGKEATLQSMVDACKEIGIHDLSVEMNRARGTYFAADHTAIDFSFSLYSSDYDGESRVIAKIISGSGCRVTFATFMSNLITILKRNGDVYYTEISEAVWDPRICPSLGSVSEDDDENIERLTRQVNSCIVECEAGYARTIAEDAPRLARFSQQRTTRTILKRVPEIFERLIKLMEPSFEPVLVRSVLVCLANLCDGDERCTRLCRDKLQLREHLIRLRDRWSQTQYPFGETFPFSAVDVSREIMIQADAAISKLSC